LNFDVKLEFFLSETLIHFNPQTLKMNGYNHFNSITFKVSCHAKPVFKLSLKQEHVKLYK